MLSGKIEAWDSPLYFRIALPMLMLISGVFGFFAPLHPWRWAITLFGAQALTLFVMKPSGNLLPFGLVLFVLMAGIAALPAYIGAWLRGFIQKLICK